MNTRVARNFVVGIFSTAAILGTSADARGDIMGFGDFSQFRINQHPNDVASVPMPNQAGNSIRLITGTANQSRSIFFETQQNIAAFSASFDYWITGTPSGPMGACFVMQRNGLNRAASPGGRFGYEDAVFTFGLSAAASLETRTINATSSSSAGYVGGNAGGGSNSISPVSLFSGNVIHVVVDYDGTLLHTRFTDTVTGASSPDYYYAMDIPAATQGTTAWVGFTASSNGNVGVDQYFGNLQFTAVPTPAALSGFGLLGLAAATRRRRN